MTNTMFYNLVNPIHFLVSTLLIISCLPNYCFCIRWNSSDASESPFSVAVATWYGDPNGAGSDGGACGYRYNVEKPPFSAMISAGNANLYQSGLGCGACYEVKCNAHPACSGKPIKVTITDECGCDSQNVHFDLSGTAFGAMAKPGQAETLRQAGTFHVDYRRAPCDYEGTALAFEVDSGSNPYYFACVPRYIKGDGDISAVELKTRDSDGWVAMQHSWGATWKADLPGGGKAPFSIRLTTLRTKKVVVAHDVIPADWAPGRSYKSPLNFH